MSDQREILAEKIRDVLRQTPDLESQVAGILELVERGTPDITVVSSKPRSDAIILDAGSRIYKLRSPDLMQARLAGRVITDLFVKRIWEKGAERHDYVYPITYLAAQESNPDMRIARLDQTIRGRNMNCVVKFLLSGAGRVDNEDFLTGDDYIVDRVELVVISVPE
jgi:hypothetical protein